MAAVAPGLTVIFMFKNHVQHKNKNKYYFTDFVNHDIVYLNVELEALAEGILVELSSSELARISNFMKSRYGVDLSEKSVLVSGRLVNKITALGYTSYNEFMDRVEADPNGEDTHLLINTLTTNHTYLMREPIHFQFMREVALPEIRQKCANTRDVRIWSAAASSGEEAYSIVMTLKDFFGFDADRWDTKVLATDISTKALAKAKEGIFTEEQTEKLPPRWLKLYFNELPDGGFQVKREYRNEIIFNTFNLMDPFPWKKRFHIIFLRNVMIYFDEDTKRELINKVYEFLEPGGYLFIGSTETIDKTATKLIHVRPSVYTKP